MDTDPITAGPSIINDLLASSSAAAMQAGTQLQGQSFAFSIAQMTGQLGLFLQNLFDPTETSARDPLNSVLDTVKGVNEATAIVNPTAQAKNTAPDMLTVGDMAMLIEQMTAFLLLNPDLAFVADILNDEIFQLNANPVTLVILAALAVSDPTPFLDALDVIQDFISGVDPLTLAFAAIGASATATLGAEAPEDAGEDPVAPTDPDTPADPDMTPTDDDPAADEDPVVGGDPAPDADLSGDDDLAGDDGPNTIDGGPGDDTVNGGGGGDSLSGGAGKDLLKGAGGADSLMGGGGKDTLEGGGGRDTLEGGGGKDVLKGGGGKDVLKGGGGKDTLEGGGGKDTLDGGGGRDRLDGGGGKDVLMGGRGRDTLEGGGGNDTFVFKAGDRGDRVTDMNFNKDKIIINDPDRGGLILSPEDFALKIIFGDDLRVTVADQDKPGKKTVIDFEDTSPEEFNTDAFEFGKNSNGELGDGDQVL